MLLCSYSYKINLDNISKTLISVFSLNDGHEFAKMCSITSAPALQSRLNPCTLKPVLYRTGESTVITGFSNTGAVISPQGQMDNCSLWNRVIYEQLGVLEFT